MAQNTISSQLSQGHYAAILLSPEAAPLIQDCLDCLVRPESDPCESRCNVTVEPLKNDNDIASAALNAFLQANVTGPVLEDQASVEDAFLTAFRVAADDSTASIQALRTKCLEALTVDGVAPYAHIPLLELFVLSRHIMHSALRRSDNEDSRARIDVRWKCLRIDVWQYKLLTQPSLSGRAFTKTAQWCDFPSLQQKIVAEIEQLENVVVSPDSSWTQQDKVEFLLEKVGASVILGLESIARSTLKQATALNGFMYALSGALGKRTKWQENSTSQLVVLAKSGATTPAIPSQGPKKQSRPETVLLNDDTLLDKIEFSQAQVSVPEASDFPNPLEELLAKPDDQPQLCPYDHVILLSEATIRDSFSPNDTLTAEEVLPFANRVIEDKSTDWQVYTHALLVRSRIEVHRSRTVERGVLQMQAVVDQMVADTTAIRPVTKNAKRDENTPSISVSSDQVAVSSNFHAGSFLPAPNPSESAPAQDRLRYVHSLFSPPRWHLESELAYGWAGVGSLVSALEIFKRLRLWAEVALCWASVGASSEDDEDGRGSGGEEKARAVLRWQLFQPSEGVDNPAMGDDIDINHLRASDYHGPERDLLPSNAPRLLCILGEIDNDPSHFERAWEVSKRRYARAQKALGEYYIRKRDWDSAYKAYKLAVGVNRLSPELWSRLGDIGLRLGRFADAGEAYSRAIGAANDTSGGEDARTWSNLGSALWSLSCEASERENNRGGMNPEVAEEIRGETVFDTAVAEVDGQKQLYDRDAANLLTQSLSAYKRGAQLAHSNWRIWDNVITIASRIRPMPAYNDMIQAMRHVLEIRNNEAAVDVDVLGMLIRDLVLSTEPDGKEGKLDLPRGSKAKAVVDLVEDVIVPLITTRDDLWELVSRERAWGRDYGLAVEASEKAWRTAMATGAAGVSGGAMLAGPTSNEKKSSGEDSKMKPRGPWTEDEKSWDAVVQRTEELVSMLENYGSRAESIKTKWKWKARMAVRSVMGKGKERWEGSQGWKILVGIQEGLSS